MKATADLINELLEHSQEGNPYTLVCLYLLQRMYGDNKLILKLLRLGVSNLSPGLAIIMLPTDDPLRPSAETEMEYAGNLKRVGLDTEELRKRAFLLNLVVSIYNLRRPHTDISLVGEFLEKYLPRPQEFVFDDTDITMGGIGDLEHEWADLAHLLDRILELNLITPKPEVWQT